MTRYKNILEGFESILNEFEKEFKNYLESVVRGENYDISELEGIYKEYERIEKEFIDSLFTLIAPFMKENDCERKKLIDVKKEMTDIINLEKKEKELEKRSADLKSAYRTINFFKGEERRNYAQELLKEF